MGGGLKMPQQITCDIPQRTSLIYDLLLRLEVENCKVVRYANDLPVLCMGKNLKRFTQLIKKTVDIPINWAEERGLVVKGEISKSSLLQGGPKSFNNHFME